MKSGEVIQDGHGGTYEVGTFLGRGLWSKSYLVRTDSNAEAILKLPLAPSDLPSGFEDLSQLSHQILNEHTALSTGAEQQALLQPIRSFSLDNGHR